MKEEDKTEGRTPEGFKSSTSRVRQSPTGSGGQELILREPIGRTSDWKPRRTMFDIAGKNSSSLRRSPSLGRTEGFAARSFRSPKNPQGA
jgi:hypothetical protein